MPERVEAFNVELTDSFNLRRFLLAQQDVYATALAELRRGRKRSHWMWFVFPQLAGLGRSPTAQTFAIGSRDEARAYLAHPVLGPRLRECAQVLAQTTEPPDAVRIFGGIDAVKLRSSMTLFSLVAPDEAVFQQVLDRFFGGERDTLTERMLGTD